MTKLYLTLISIFISILLLLVFIEPIQRSAIGLFDSFMPQSEVPANEPAQNASTSPSKTSSKASSDALLTLITKDISLLDLEPLQVQYKASQISDRVFLDDINSEIIDGQLLITPSLTANKSAFFKLLLGLGGEVVGINNVVHEYQVVFKDPSFAKAQLDAHPMVNSAIYNLVMTTQSVSEDPWKVDGLALTFVDQNKDYIQAADPRITKILDAYQALTLNSSGQIYLYRSDLIPYLSKISDEIYSTYKLAIWSDLGAYIPDYGFVSLDVMSESVIRTTNVDQAWTLVDQMTPMKVGIVDIGIEANYKDILLDPSHILNEMDVPNVSHGSHVLGIVAATHDNGIGIAGIGINAIPYTYEWTDLASIKEGISKMFEAEVSIINLSIGLNTTVAETARLETQSNASDFVNTLLDYYKASGEFLLIIGAGNAGLNSSNYQLFLANPSHEDNVIVVGSASYNTENDLVQRAGHSCYGDQIDLYAPGEKILSVIGVDSYGISTGTSMAAPYVSGVVSMIWGLNPDLKAPEVKAALLTSDQSLEVDGQAFPLINAMMSLESVLTLE